MPSVRARQDSSWSVAYSARGTGHGFCGVSSPTSTGIAATPYDFASIAGNRYDDYVTPRKPRERSLASTGDVWLRASAALTTRAFTAQPTV
jgi:hypothetical protein